MCLTQNSYWAVHFALLFSGGKDKGWEPGWEPGRDTVDGRGKGGDGSSNSLGSGRDIGELLNSA